MLVSFKELIHMSADFHYSEEQMHSCHELFCDKKDEFINFEQFQKVLKGHGFENLYQLKKLE